MDIFLFAFTPENFVSRDGFGSPVPRKPSHFHTQAEPGAYIRDSSRVPRKRPCTNLSRHTPSSQSRVYRVTQLRAHGVHRRESASSGPVNLKVVPNDFCLGSHPHPLSCSQTVLSTIKWLHPWHTCLLGHFHDYRRQPLQLPAEVKPGTSSLTSTSPFHVEL